MSKIQNLLRVIRIILVIGIAVVLCFLLYHFQEVLQQLIHDASETSKYVGLVLLVTTSLKNVFDKSSKLASYGGKMIHQMSDSSSSHSGLLSSSQNREKDIKKTAVYFSFISDVLNIFQWAITTLLLWQIYVEYNGDYHGEKMWIFATIASVYFIVQILTKVFKWKKPKKKQIVE